MDKGKNFSRNRARVDRAEADFYQTPHCLTDEFISHHAVGNWPTDACIADFCCGKKAIQTVLEKRGYTSLYASDMNEGFNYFDFHGEGTFR